MQISAELLFSQVTQSAESKIQPVNWLLLTGNNNEFFFIMPEGSSIYTAQHFNFNSPGKGFDYTEVPFFEDSRDLIEIDSERTLVRAINNTVLLISSFEGNGKLIKKALLSRFRDTDFHSFKDNDIHFFPMTSDNQKLLKIAESEVNGFGVTDISLETVDCSAKAQIFQSKNQVYYVEGLSHIQSNPIIKAYFDGIKLVNKNRVVSPNQNNKVEDFTTAKLIMPAPISENAKPSGEITDLKKVEKKPVLSYLPHLPELPKTDRQLNNAFISIEAKVLFSADGTIGDVKFNTVLSKAFEKELLKSVKEIKFLPAEMDGKPVSFYGKMTYSYYFSRKKILN